MLKRVRIILTVLLLLATVGVDALPLWQVR